MGKLDKLIQAIAESGDEKVMSAFLEWQDEGIKAKERLIEKLDKLLKTSEGKPETTSENSLHKHFVSVSLPSEDEINQIMHQETNNLFVPMDWKDRFSYRLIFQTGFKNCYNKIVERSQGNER